MSRIIPINSNLNGSLTTSFTASLNFNNNMPLPIMDEDEIVLEMNGIGPIGPKGVPGERGTGISKIEKTSTSGLVDTYTIYFTDGTEFNYDITNGVVYYYNGPYEVTPSINSQSLSTMNLVMRDNVNINQIPYQEVSNLSGGYTAIIGN